MTGINGGDSAEQIVHIMFQGMDIALRLTGSATKNLAQLLIMATKNEKMKVRRGETSLVKLLREGKELRTYRMKVQDLPEFKRQAKPYGILFAAVKDTRTEDGYCDLILRSEDIPRFNTVIEHMGLTGFDKEPDSKKNDRSGETLSSSKASSKSSATRNKPSVKEKLQAYQTKIKQKKPRVKEQVR